MIQIVIARYNENLDWLSLIPSEYEIIVYNKGKKITNTNENIKIIEIENIGRESHTYLQHIIKNYNNLSNKIVFCQGDTIFHSPNFIELLKNHELFENIQPLSSFYDENIPPHEVTNYMSFCWINGMKVHFEYVNNKFETVYPYFYYNKLMSEVFKKINYNLTDYIQNILECKNFNEKYLIPVSYAGIFSVTKNVILENSLKKYKNILNFLLYDKQIGIDNGFVIERLWMTIFNFQKNNKHYQKLYSNKYILKNINLTQHNNKIKGNLNLVVSPIFITFQIENKQKNIKCTLLIGKKYIILKIGSNKYKKIIDLGNNNSIKIAYEVSLIDKELCIIVNNKIFCILETNKNLKINNAVIYDILEYQQFREG